MRYKLVGNNREFLGQLVTIITSTDLSVLENMRQTLEPFGIYSNLRVERA